MYMYMYICTNQHKSTLIPVASFQTYTIDKAVLETETLHVFRILNHVKILLYRIYIYVRIYIVFITKEYFIVATESWPEC